MAIHPTSASWLCPIIELSTNGKRSGEGEGDASGPVLCKKICLYLRHHMGSATGMGLAVELDETFVEKAFDLS